MNTPVNFKLAKLLKEKRFDENCRFGYDGSFEPHHIGLIEFGYLQRNSELLKLTYSAPTIAEVVCWIYSKYQIWVQVSILKDDEWHYSIRRKNNNWNIEFPTKEKFTSIENAYEKGINVVLNTYKPKS